MLEPVQGMVVTENVKFRPGTYNFNGGAGITIAANDITVDGTEVTILNAAQNEILPEATSGVYAYKLNEKNGETANSLTRKIDFTKSTNINISLYAKAAALNGELLIQASEDNVNYTTMSTTNTLMDWENIKADLSAYHGKQVYVRISYEQRGPQAATGLLLDTIEIFEDDVRTFSDLAEAKVFYWWDVAYTDGVRVEDSLVNKPFDRNAYTVSKAKFKGTGIKADGVSGVTIKGFTVSGFYWAMNLNNCTDMLIEKNNLSNNVTDPNGGWGDQEGGALKAVTVSESTIKDNTANNNSNGLALRYSNNNIITNNDFSVNSDVCLEMKNASYNRIEDNNFSWGIRIDANDEVHARDSTSQLMESGSNYNKFFRNDFTHGGSDESVLDGNEAAYNGIMPHNAPEAFGNAGVAIVNGTGEHIKIINNNIHNNYGPGIALRFKDVYKTHHYVIQNNRIMNNLTSPYNSSHKGYAIYLDQGDWFDISGNKMENNSLDQIYKTATATNVFERNGSYLENPQDYENQASMMWRLPRQTVPIPIWRG